MKNLFALAAAGMTAAGCSHDNFGNYGVRQNAAHETCEARYEEGRQNYLAAIETIIESTGVPNATMAPLDAFRAEVNAAYNSVVQRCKTHTHCLESNRYNEAKCYMASGDRTNAENRFANLSVELRIIQNQMNMFAGAVINSPSVSVTTSVNNANKQKQGQEQKQKSKADAHNGHDVDQDILAVCGDVNGLLDERCRRPCRNRC